MKSLLILAHPYDGSFNHGLVDSIVEKLKEKDQEVILRDLYKLGFNPVLDASELTDLRSGKVRDDVKIEQGFISECDNIILVFPIWWTSLPAILKGYIDRVFSYGFAFGHNDQGVVEGLLKNKKVTIISTQGTPSEIYDTSGMTESLKKTIDKGIFEFSALEVKEHIFLGGIPNIEKEEGSRIINEVISRI